jgi:hypothetical protein
MRANVILSVLGLALVVLLPAVYFHYKSDQPAAAESAATDDSTNAAALVLPAILHRVTASVNAQDTVSAQSEEAADLNAPGHPEYVTQRKAELYQLGMSQTPESLHDILIEVHNPDPAIRQAALAATMDFGSKDAIPTLQQEMTWAEDPEEKFEIHKAIEFPQLPPFSLDENGAISQQ